MTPYPSLFKVPGDTGKPIDPFRFAAWWCVSLVVLFVIGSLV